MSVAFQVGRAKAEKWPKFCSFSALQKFARLRTGKWALEIHQRCRQSEWSKLGPHKGGEEGPCLSHPPHPAGGLTMAYRRPRAASQPPFSFFLHIISLPIYYYTCVTTMIKDRAVLIFARQRLARRRGTKGIDWWVPPSYSAPSSSSHFPLPLSLSPPSSSFFFFFAEFYINSCFLLRHFTVFYLFFLSCKEERKEKSKKLFSFYFILVFGSAHIFQ